MSWIPTTVALLYALTVIGMMLRDGPDDGGYP